MSEKSEADLRAEVESLQEQIKQMQNPGNRTFPIVHTKYVHSNKEDNWNEAIDELKLPTEEAQRNYAYAGREISLSIVVYEDGSVICTALNGVQLVRPVSI